MHWQVDLLVTEKMLPSFIGRQPVQGSGYIAVVLPCSRCYRCLALRNETRKIFCLFFRNSKIGKQAAVNRPKTTDNAHRNPERLSSLKSGGGTQPARRPGRQSLGGAAQQPRIITAQPRAKKRLSLPANAQPRIRGSGTTTDTVQRPKTASEVKRSSRLAANFSK